LGPIEVEATARFSEYGMPLAAIVPTAERGEMPLSVHVAGDPPVGFLWMTLVCGQPHVEELAVVPSEGRRGLGRALLESACRWAGAAGYRTVTLCAFRDVPWNGPFYRSAGFVELDQARWCPELVAIRATERANGLDDVGPRVVMVRRLDEARPSGSTR